MNNCYCGRSKPYQECCRILHLDITQAKTAEDLMRSRYTTYALAKIDYLMKSHHQSTRPLKEKKEILRWAKSMHWIRLEVLNSSKGKKDDTDGTVEFKAFYHDDQGIQMIHENSSFVKQNGYWVYLDAI